MKILIVSPAYGRDYKNKKACLSDWNDNKNFIIHDYHISSYVNKRQTDKLIKDGFTHIEFRYAKLTKVIFQKLG